MKIVIKFERDLCTDCGVCHTIFPGLVDMFDNSETLEIEANGAAFLQAGRAVFSCPHEALSMA